MFKINEKKIYLKVGLGTAAEQAKMGCKGKKKGY